MTKELCKEFLTKKKTVKLQKKAERISNAYEDLKGITEWISNEIAIAIIKEIGVGKSNGMFKS